MKKIKIAQVVQLQILYGSQRVALDIASQLDPDRYDVWIVCAPAKNPDNAFAREVKRLGLKTHIIWHLRRLICFHDIFAFFEMLNFFRAHQFDIVHSHGSKAGFLARIAAKLAGVPRIVHTVHGVSYHQCLPGIVRWLFRGLERFAGQFSDRIVFVSDNQRRQAVDMGILPTEKAVTIYNGVVEATRRERDFSGDTLTIGSVGRFWDQKNYVVSIRVAIEACKKNPALRFVFLGDGEYLPRCTAMVRKSGMSDRIFLPGWQDNVASWLEKFDVFMLYSLWEGLPVAILEAMNAGLPIIASDIDGNNELVDSSNGFLVDVTRPKDLLKLLTSLTTKQNELTAMSKQSIRKIRENFLLDRMKEGYLELYEG